MRGLIRMWHMTESRLESRLNTGVLSASCVGVPGFIRAGICVLAAIVTMGLLLEAAPISAQEDDDDETYEEEAASTVRDADDRRYGDDGTAGWMPSMAISWGIYSQSINGRTFMDPEIPQGDGDSLISTMFQFNGKLHTPLQLKGVPLKPRVFLSAGYQLPLADELIAERIDDSFDQAIGGDVPDFRDNCPTNVPGPNPPPINNPNLEATTCSIRVRNRVTVDAAWYVGVGVDLTVPVLESQFHIMPAFEYYGLAAHTVGDFERSSSGTQLPTNVQQANVVGNSEIYHGVSPSLTLSVDVFDDGPWRWSLFLQTRVVFLLTDPLTKATSSGGVRDVTFVSELDDFIAQGTGGIQLQWTGR